MPRPSGRGCITLIIGFHIGTSFVSLHGSNLGPSELMPLSCRRARRRSVGRALYDYQPRAAAQTGTNKKRTGTPPRWGCRPRNRRGCPRHGKVGVEYACRLRRAPSLGRRGGLAAECAHGGCRHSGRAAATQLSAEMRGSATRYAPSPDLESRRCASNAFTSPSRQCDNARKHAR